MDNKILKSPPITNRGVDTPTAPVFREINYFLKENNSYFLFDWLQCTLHKDINIFSLFKDLFHIDRQDVLVSNQAFFGYNVCYSYKDIKVFQNDFRDDMGIHIYITGQGCRDIEDLNIKYYDLFKKLSSLGAFFTRLDVSIDVFNDNYFSVDKVLHCIKNNEVCSKFRNSIEFRKTNLSNSFNDGLTIWFGSRSSKIQIVFYDKLKERECNNYIVSKDIIFWNRLEVRLKDEYANEFIYNFLNNDFYTYFIGVLNNYISFKVYNSDDLKHKYRWKNAVWWDKFLNDINKIKFSPVNISDSITKKYNWLDKSVSRSNFMVFISTLDTELSFDSMSSNYLYEFLKEGRDRITQKDLQYINSYRLKNNLNPITFEFMNSLLLNLKVLLNYKK